jgi:hypothetical protein
MNREQLKKINGLVVKLDDIEELLSEGKCYGDIIIRPRRENPPIISIEFKALEPLLIACRDKLKAELKELGYEE